jgi:hypothetical protein
LLLFNTEHKLTITTEDAYNGITGWFNGFKSITTYPIQELDTTITDEVEEDVEFFTDSNDDDDVDIFEDLHNNFCSGITLEDAPF